MRELIGALRILISVLDVLQCFEYVSGLGIDILIIIVYRFALRFIFMQSIVRLLLPEVLESYLG